MPIVEELELDITSALDAIESLNEPLTALGENLTITLTSAIEAVDVQPLADQLAAIDAAGLTTTIDASIEAADGTVPIEADTSAVPEEINASIDSADTTVVLEPDVSDFGGSIDEALAAADTTVFIEGEIGDIAGDIESEIASADTTITLETDAAGLSDFTSGVDEATGSIGGLDSAAAGLVGGDILGSITGGLGKAGPAGAIAAAGIGAATAGVFALVEAGTDALASQQRFADTFGNLADQASRVRLGSLNADLGELAIKLGSDDEGLQDAASSLFQFGQAAGFTSEQSLELVNNASALAARAVALNPALGQVGDVAASISNAFARGGKFAAKYGLSLTAAEINARALSNTGKTTAAELSIQDKAFAGSQIAAERYGEGLEKTVNKGSKNAAIQQRSLNEQLQNFIEEAGKPLVAPFQEILKELLPVVKALLPVFSELAQAVLPILVEVIKDNAPTIKLFGQLLKELSPIIAPLIRVSIAMLNPLIGISKAFSSISNAGAGIGDLFSGITETIAGFLSAVTSLGSDLIDSFLVGIQEAFPAVLNFFGSVGSTILTTIGDFVSTLTQKGTDLITGFFTGITTTIVTVFTFFANLAGTIFNTIGDVVGTLAQKGIDFIQGLFNGISTKFREVVSFVGGFPRRIIGAFGNFFSKMVTLGGSIIDGLIAGIVNKAKGFFSTLTSLAKQGIHLITHPWEALSPSRVTRRLGENIGEGLALGIQSQVSAVEDAASALSAAAAITPATLALPAVAATVPLSGGIAGAAAAGSVTSAQLGAGTAGNGGIVINVTSTSPNPVDVGLETVRQMQALQFRTQR